MSPKKLSQWVVRCNSTHPDIMAVRTVEKAFEQQSTLSWPLKIGEPEVIGQRVLGGFVRPIARISHKGIEITMTRLYHDSTEWVVSVVSDRVLNPGNVVPFWRATIPGVYDLRGKQAEGDEFPVDRRFPIWSVNDSSQFTVVVRAEYLHTLATIILVVYNAAG